MLTGQPALLAAATPFFAEWVHEKRAEIEILRQTTAEFADGERLAARYPRFALNALAPW